MFIIGTILKKALKISFLFLIFFILSPNGIFCLNLENPRILLVQNLNEFSNIGSTPSDQNLTQSSPNVFVVASNISSIVIICNASYPVTWEMHPQLLEENESLYSWMHSQLTFSIRTSRRVRKMYDLSSYEFSATLSIYGTHFSNEGLTGNYTCVHAQKKNIASSVYIYWQGLLNNNFIHQNKTLTVYVWKNSLTLPCASSRPDFPTPLLQKIEKSENGEIFKNIDYNSSISFIPTVGIVLKNDYPRALIGKYRCSLNSRYSKDFVNVTVNLLSSLLTNKTFRLEPSISFIQNTSSINCCATKGKKAPYLYHYYCNHPSTCSFYRRFSVKKHFLKESSNVRRKIKNGCASIKLHAYTSGIVRCINSNGAYDRKQYIFGTNLLNASNYYSHPIYYDWTDIEPLNMINIQINSNQNIVAYNSKYGKSFRRKIKPTYTNEVEQLYTGQIVSFYCHASEYYFSEGNQWGIKWKNNTFQYLDNRNTANMSILEKYQMGLHFDNNFINIPLNVGMSGVVCMAPVWNSSEFIPKTIDLSIIDPIAPSIYGDHEEKLIFTLNETNREIICESTGLPLPNLSWTADDNVKMHHHHANFTTSENISIAFTLSVVGRITFKRVTYLTEGIYNCTSTNYGGTVYKIYKVSVIEPDSSSKKLWTAFGVLAIILLIVAIGSIALKLKKPNKNFIAQRFNNESRDDIGSNTTYPPVETSNMSDNLIS